MQRLDAAGSDIFVGLLGGSGRVAAIGSEEIEDPVVAGEDRAQAYIVQMDPVDGSSNIDVAVTIGSIFGIWRRSPGEPVDGGALLRRGREQTAAAYVVYGSSTVLVAATKGGVNGFTLDAGSGDFILTHPDIRFPDRCEYYSTNEGNFGRLDDRTQTGRFDAARLPLAPVRRLTGRRFPPEPAKGRDIPVPWGFREPAGKLRLMYEANPLGFVAEQAGGAAYSHDRRILDIVPETLHQRTPLILGNKAEVEQTVAIISGR